MLVLFSAQILYRQYWSWEATFISLNRAFRCYFFFFFKSVFHVGDSGFRVVRIESVLFRLEWRMLKSIVVEIFLMVLHTGTDGYTIGYLSPSSVPS